MRMYRCKYQLVSILTTLCLVLLAISGCAKVGPKSISTGRADYNEVINRTENEQMLLWIVKFRYGETSSLLAVTSVASNVRFRTEVNLNAGFETDGDGAIGSLGGGLSYEENPTITYVPVKGEQYIKELLSPIPLEYLVLFMRAVVNPDMYFIALVDKVNDIKNPDFHKTHSSEPDPRFQRLVELVVELRDADVIHWYANPSKDVAFNILINNYAPAYTKDVREYLTLLGLPTKPVVESKDIILPVYFAIKARKLDGIAISTRSIYDLIEILSASINIPQDHASRGLALNFPKLGLAGKDIHIYTSKDKPKNAEVAVKHRGYWFYLDETDTNTKLFYRLVRTLWSITIVSGTDKQGAPVLTIPVSR